MCGFSSFRITGVCSSYVVSLCDFAYYVFGLQLHLALWDIALVCHQYNVCENSVGHVYIGRYDGLIESGLGVFRELFPVTFLVVGECASVLL